jgi:small subunit ribosomal protein S16
MVKIRLQRVGRRNKPSFRIVAQDSRTAPSGRVLEILGFYNPSLKQKNIKKDRLEYWLSQGAQTSDTVHNLLVSEGIIPGPKRNVARIKPKTAPEKPSDEPSKEALPQSELEPKPESESTGRQEEQAAVDKPKPKQGKETEKKKEEKKSEDQVSEAKEKAENNKTKDKNEPEKAKALDKDKVSA